MYGLLGTLGGYSVQLFIASGECPTFQPSNARHS